MDGSGPSRNAFGKVRVWFVACSGDRSFPANVYAMRVIIVAVLTIRADDMNVKLSAMLTCSSIRCSAARTATHA